VQRVKAWKNGEKTARNEQGVFAGHRGWGKKHRRRQGIPAGNELLKLQVSKEGLPEGRKKARSKQEEKGVRGLGQPELGLGSMGVREHPEEKHASEGERGVNSEGTGGIILPLLQNKKNANEKWGGMREAGEKSGERERTVKKRGKLV